jgi:hypothetical protein
MSLTPCIWQVGKVVTDDLEKTGDYGVSVSKRGWSRHTICSRSYARRKQQVFHMLTKFLGFLLSGSLFQNQPQRQSGFERGGRPQWAFLPCDFEQIVG